MSPMKKSVYDDLFASLIGAGHGEKEVTEFLSKHFSKMYERVRWLYCQEEEMDYEPDDWSLSAEEMEERKYEDYDAWEEFWIVERLLSKTALTAI